MRESTISIITPSYNQAEYITDTIDSVQNQTYGSVEHIIVDGGSTDGTIEILEGYSGCDGLTWISEPDEGQSDAINKGFERSSGEIVAWLNSDDAYFDVRTFERVAEAFRLSDADVVYGDLAYMDEASLVTGVDIRPDFDRRKLAYRILIGQPAAFFRAEVIENQQLDTKLAYGMDYEFWLRLARDYDFKHVRDVWAAFRRYPEQKSEDQEAMASEMEEILVEYADWAQTGTTVMMENAKTEVRRTFQSIVTAFELHRSPPELAFEGTLAPLRSMLLNVAPAPEDVLKAWRRWRSEGHSG